MFVYVFNKRLKDFGTLTRCEVKFCFTERYQVGFSVYRPIISHINWDCPSICSFGPSRACLLAKSSKVPQLLFVNQSISQSHRAFESCQKTNHGQIPALTKIRHSDATASIQHRQPWAEAKSIIFLYVLVITKTCTNTTLFLQSHSCAAKMKLPRSLTDRYCCLSIGKETFGCFSGRTFAFFYPKYLRYLR